MMITRKTRLTSGLVAILMVVTMLAAFVFPVSAAESQYTGVSEMAELGREYTTEWGINKPEDWHAAVALSKTGETFAGLTLHFGADIDFDADKSGEVEADEYVGVLGGVDVGFAGNIHGHGHVIKNLYIKHDIGVDGHYVGLIGYIAKSGVVIRDLGIESGKIHATGKGGTDHSDEKKYAYVGAFMAYSGNTVTFANCWNGAEVYSDAHVYETDMATFGRTAYATIVNCYNTGLLKVDATGETTKEGKTYKGGTVRVMPFFDWGGASNIVKNSFNLGVREADGYKVSKSDLFSFGSGLDTVEEYETVAASMQNVYSVDVTDFSDSGVDSYVTLSDYKLSEEDYVSGKLAATMNTNYDTAYDKDYGHKYYAVKDGKTVFAESEYDATFTLSVSKKMGSYLLGTETSYHTATEIIEIPAFDNYVLSDYSWEILPNFQTNTFPMPTANVQMTFSSAEPDWDLVAELVEKYTAFVESGHVATMAKEAEIYELQSKLEALYSKKDTLDKDLAIRMIGQYAGEDANLDLSPKEGLTYPNLPLLRHYVSGSKGDWLIRDAADWQAAVEYSNAGASFSGVTFHFAGDIDMENIAVDSLGSQTAFKGNIYGHGYAFKNLLVEHDLSEGNYVGWIARTDKEGQVIRDVGLENGLIKAYGTPTAAVYAGLFLGYGSAKITFANCWAGVDLTVGTEDAIINNPKEIDVAVFGRTGSLSVINCFVTGDLSSYATTGTNRVDAIADWVGATEVKEDGVRVGYTTNIDFRNIFSLSEMTAKGGTPYRYLFSMSNTYSTANAYSDTEEEDALREKLMADTAKNVVNVYASGVSATNRSVTNTAIGDRIAVTKDMGKTGELAWKLNKNYDTTYDAEYGRKYYTVKDGKTVFGTESEQPVKVTLKNGETVLDEFYALLGGETQLASFYTNCQVVEAYAASVDADNVLTFDSIPDGMELTVNVEFAEGLDYAELLSLIREYNAVENKDEYKSHLTSDSLSETLEQAKSATYASQDEINAAVTLLKSYSNGISILECTNKDEMVGAYTVSSVKELEYLSTVRDWLTAEQVVYFIGEIDVTDWTVDTYPEIDGDVNKMEGLNASLDGDMDGDGNYATIKGLRVIDDLEPSATYDSGWLGSYGGAYIKNLNFVDCSATVRDSNYSALLAQFATHADFVAENLNFDNCANIADPQGKDCETSLRDVDIAFRKYFKSASGTVTIKKVKYTYTGYKTQYEATLEALNSMSDEEWNATKESYQALYDETYQEVLAGSTAETEEAKAQEAAAVAKKAVNEEAAYQQTLAAVKADENEAKNLELIQADADGSAHTHQCRTSLIVGQVSTGCVATFDNIKIVNSTLGHNSYGGNAGFLLGSQNTATITIRNIYLNDNTIGGKVNASVGILIGEINAGSGQNAVLENIVVTNTVQAASNEKTPRAVLAGSFKSGKMTLKNIVVNNNGITGQLLNANSATAVGTLKDYADIYTDTDLVLYAEKSTSVADVKVAKNTAGIASGEAAWKANNAGYTMTWSVVDGEMIPSATGLARKVTFDYTYLDDVALYTDSEGKLIGLTSEITSGTWEGHDNLANEVFTADTVIKQPVCNHVFTYTPDGTGKHTISCENGCGYQQAANCSWSISVGNGTIHVKECTICHGTLDEACNKVMTHINGTSGADSKHSETCTICGYASAETACDFAKEKVEHTDQMNGYTKCTCECGYSYTAVDDTKVHEWATEGTVLKEATYNEKGLVAYKCLHCEAIDYRETDALATTEAYIALTAPRSELPGGTVQVNVTLKQNPGLTGMNMMIEYDPTVLTLAENGVVDHGKFSQTQIKTADGKIRLTYLNENNIAGDLSLATLTFTVLDEAALGTTLISASMIKDANDPTYTGAVNYDGDCINVLDAKVLVEVVENLWADADGDGIITTADAQIIMQWKVGMDVAIDLKAADADRNGVVELADALMILQYVNRKINWDPKGTTKAPVVI